jgi:hypothetical protein
MTQEPPPNSLTLRHGKTTVTARGWGLVVILLIALIFALLLGLYLLLPRPPPASPLTLAFLLCSISTLRGRRP